MSPFLLRYTLSRRQRLRVEVVPWLPAMAGTTGFSLGAAYAGLFASHWFLLLLLLPPVVYRGLFAFAFDIVVRGGRAVDIHVADGEMDVRTAGEVKLLPLDGVFQFFHSGDTWTLLHLDGTMLTIPDTAITSEQVEYLRSFARRAVAARAEARS